MTRRAICTIVSRNYLAFARTLAHSFRAFHADERIFVLIVDSLAGIDAEREPFEVVDVEALGIPEFRAMAFKYGIMELNTAVKPFLLKRLLEDHGVDELLYFDPDILVTASLSPIFDRLAEHPILLIPHVMRPYEDDKRPNETDLLRTGVYNLGFIGIAKTASTLEMLHWWQRRCQNGCIVRFEDGLFVDQKWIDLVPCMHPEAGILHDPGCNVAYWNLHERAIEWSAAPKCNGVPLRFFHFSGFDPRNLDAISKHQDRFRLEQRPDLRELFEEYRSRLERNGWNECASLPYAFGSFDDGDEIDPIVRRLYFSLAPDARRAFGDPFATAHSGSFKRWLREPASLQKRYRPHLHDRRRTKLRSWVQRALAPLLPDGYVDRLAYFLHQSEPSLQRRFPDLFGRDRRAYLRWLHKHRPRLYRSPPLEQFVYDVVRDEQLHPLHRFLDPSLVPDANPDLTRTPDVRSGRGSDRR